MSDTPITAAPLQRLTTSRMTAMQLCPRRHYWGYEVGLRRTEDAAALRFGSAWHRGMEARWQGQDCAHALALAVGQPDDAQGVAADLYEVAKLAAMLRAYYMLYPTYSPVRTIFPEVQFEQPIDGSRRFVSAGKLDGIADMEDGTLGLVEHKTTSESVADDSPYWQLLACNPQVLQYVDAARAHGHDLSTVFYDVAHKPGIAPCKVPKLDDAGLKIVLYIADNSRVFNKDGKTPRQTGGEGMYLWAREETPEEYADRLHADIMDRPGFYFARKTVTVLDDTLAEFRESRLAVSRMILDRRRAQDTMTAPHRAWPRTINKITCGNCPFASFCLNNQVPDTANPPEGFTILSDVHPELQESI